MQPYNEQFDRREQKTLASAKTALANFAASKTRALPAFWTIPCYIAYDFCEATAVHVGRMLAATPAGEGAIMALIA